MRTHETIVKDHGATKLAQDLKTVGVNLAANTPQRWADRDRIPPEYWSALVELGIASGDELAAAHRPRKRRDDAPRAAA